MARNPTFVFTQARVDRSGEPCSISFNVTDGAFDLEDLGAIALMNAIDNVIDGAVKTGTLSTITRVSNVAHATTGQREDKWLLQYEDTTTHVLYNMELPCRKKTLEPPVDTDLMPLAEAPWSALKTAFDNGIIKSPDGNAVSLQSVRYVGRNT